MNLSDLWLYPPYLLAGFGGSVLYVFRLKEKTAGSIAGVLVTGTLMANYGSALIEKWLGPGIGAAFSAFATGIVGTILTDGIIAKAQAWIGRNGSSQGHPR
jgi:hypothetical protein